MLGEIEAIEAIEAIEDVVRVIGTRKDADMETESECWSRHRARPRYRTFRLWRFPIGSGAIESAVRTCSPSHLTPSSAENHRVDFSVGVLVSRPTPRRHQPEAPLSGTTLSSALAAA